MNCSLFEKRIIYLLFFFSGAVGLVYEVLWLKELQLLFGNTAYATATTLSVFFLGLSAGGWDWGKRSPSISSLLKAYGLLEIGIGLTAMLYFLLLRVYRAVYSPLFEIFETTRRCLSSPSSSCRSPSSSCLPFLWAGPCRC